MDRKLKRYGVWAGNPKGIIEDVTRCIGTVYSNRCSSRQCSRKREHGLDKLYCKQHDPDRIAAKIIAKDVIWQKNYDIKEAYHKRLQKALKLIEGIPTESILDYELVLKTPTGR